MKTTHQREMQKATKEKQTKTERSKRNRSYSERVRAKWFCFSFKLGFLQLTCKASLILKSNLELASSISIGKNKKKKNIFNEIEYDQLYPSGSAPARIYGTHKMHKFSSSDSFAKLRRIVSSIDTFNHNLASFLCDLLSALVPNDYSSKDTFSFVSQIKNANITKKHLVFYDLTSIFTNIPLQQTIDVAINLIFNHNPNLNITRK